MKIKTKLIEFEKENRNGRIYPKELMNSVMEQLKSKNSPLYGELGQDNNSFDISLKNISHTIENIYVDDNSIYGNIRILDTPKGKIVKELLNNSQSIGIASRGMGSINSDGTVSDNFKLLTFDLVADPSFDIYISRNTKEKYIDKIQELKETWEKLELKKDS